MESEIKELRGKLDTLEHEAANLRLSFAIMSRQHSQAKAVLHEMAELSLAAAKRSAEAADNAVIATKKAVTTAEQVAVESAFATENVALKTAAAAGVAAVEAAVAATHAVSAAARTAAYHNEKTAHDALMQSVSRAEGDARLAVDNALEAIKLTYAAAEGLIAKAA